MADRRRDGAVFEDLASSYLEARGYRILERNVILLRKEVDIVAADGDTIVFIEVKGRRSARFGCASEAVAARKQHHLVKAAVAYLGRRGLWASPCRFDVIAVDATPGRKPVFEHIENAFGA
ncbi:MAG: YraN family protein [bacterium]